MIEDVEIPEIDSDDETESTRNAYQLLKNYSVEDTCAWDAWLMMKAVTRMASKGPSLVDYEVSDSDDETTFDMMLKNYDEHSDSDYILSEESDDEPLEYDTDASINSESSEHSAESEEDEPSKDNDQIEESEEEEESDEEDGDILELINRSTHNNVIDQSYCMLPV